MDKTTNILNTPPISAFVTNLGKYNEGALVGEWLALPTTPEQVSKLFERIGMDGVRYEEFFITDYETNISGLYEHLGEYTGLDELNYLAALLEDMDSGERDKFEAAVEYGNYTDSMKDIINLAQNLDCYEYYSEIQSDSDLGRYWVEESGVYDTEQMGTLGRYIDYESFGRDIRFDEGGCFAGSGYVHSSGNDFAEEYNGMEVPDEYRVFSLPSDEPDIELDNVNGYEVQKSVQFSNGRGMAYGVNPDAVQPYVTWMYKEDGGERSYYWGHYFSDKERAKGDFSERVLEYKKDYGVEIVPEKPQKTKEKKEQERE